MNNKERNEIRKIGDRVSDEIESMLQEIQDMLQEYADNEQEKIDNLPDSLQDGERANRMYEYIYALEGVCSDIDSVMSGVIDIAVAIKDIADDNI